MNNSRQSEQFPVWQGGKLRCKARIQETHDSVTFTLEADTPSRFAYRPGQFITIGIAFNDAMHHRAYSISSCPLQQNSLDITVKRVSNGKVSNYLIDHWNVGDWLDAQAPAGEFHLPDETPDQTLVFLSAGSGVTPMMSMARWLLAKKHDAAIHFIYSAHGERDIIFRDELLSLAQQYPHFRLDLFLSQPEGTIPCHAGRLTHEQLNALVSQAAARCFYLCGNPDYIAMVEDWFDRNRLPDDRLLKESFSPPDISHETGNGQTFKMLVPAFGTAADAADGQTLLEIMEAENLPIIAACRSGLCGSCKCQVTEGKVERLSTETLTPSEIEAGYALACSTRVRSSVTVELNT